MARWVEIVRNNPVRCIKDAEVSAPAFERDQR